MTRNAYKPKIMVVRCLYDHEHGSGWRTDGTGMEEDKAERAYLVRGLPMLGEKVVAFAGSAVGTVTEIRAVVSVLWEKHDKAMANYDPSTLRPYDPDEALVERVKKMLVAKGFSALGDKSIDAVAHAAVKAMREASDD